MFKKSLWFALFCVTFINNGMHRINRQNENQSCCTQREVAIGCVACFIGFFLGCNERDASIRKHCKSSETVQSCRNKLKNMY